MTHHDLLIDSIMQYLYAAYNQGRNDELWDFYNDGEVKAQEILEIVEEFQELRAKVGREVTYLKPRPQWRASD
jgi:hypothetical protein